MEKIIKTVPPKDTIGKGTYPIAASVGYIEGIRKNKKAKVHPLLMREGQLLASLLREFLDDDQISNETKHKIRMYLDVRGEAAEILKNSLMRKVEKHKERAL